MRLTHEIFLEQQQKLLMTPELRQAIAILQMSTLELREHIQTELEENPFLEEKEIDDEGDNLEKEEESDTSKIEEWLEYYNDRDTGFTAQEQKEEKSFENFISRRPTLYEHLEFQLHLASKNPEDLAVGIYIIGCIDDNGYLAVDLKEVANYLKCDIRQVEEVLKLIQTFSPYGVGARSLAECLLLQLKHYGKESPVMEKIVVNHLGDLARGRLNRIAQDLALPVQKVQELCDLIRSLDPKPGLQYSSNEIKYIIPDVYVEHIEGEYIVVVNDFYSPRLIVNRAYENILRQGDGFPGEARKYLEEKMNSAVWLIKSIEQRRMTLYKVTRCIVDIQRGFLDKGVKYLKPLNLRQVADIVDVHESTVSRATSNKYAQTPQGVFELKYFFSTGVELFNGSDRVSAKSIKCIVEEIIAGEDASKPYSDETIARLLEKKGIKISRRTVAKYRQEMGILSTMARRRY